MLLSGQGFLGKNSEIGLTSCIRPVCQASCPLALRESASRRSEDRCPVNVSSCILGHYLELDLPWMPFFARMDFPKENMRTLFTLHGSSTPHEALA